MSAVNDNDEDYTAAHIIADAFQLAYGGAEDETASEFWGVGADLAVTMLIDNGLLPTEADPMSDCGSEGAQA